MEFLIFFGLCTLCIVVLFWVHIGSAVFERVYDLPACDREYKIQFNEVYYKIMIKKQISKRDLLFREVRTYDWFDHNLNHPYGEVEVTLKFGSLKEAKEELERLKLKDRLEINAWKDVDLQ